MYTTSGDVDFNSTTQTATIIAGTSNSTINITLYDDDIFEDDESFNISLTVPTSNNSRITAGNITSAIGLIIDITGECYP